VLTLASVGDVAQVAADVISATALAALVWSIVLLRRQTSAVADQARHASVQAQHAANATLATVYQNIAMQMHDINRFFLDNPHLRGHFIRDEPVEEDDPEGERLECLAEMMVDLMDNFVTQSPMLDPRLCEGWREYFLDLYKRSPPIREYWKGHWDWYQSEMQALLGVPSEAR
jgi:hypothetical protein